MKNKILRTCDIMSEDLILGYIENSLGKEKSEEIKQHIALCSMCDRYRDKAVRTLKSFKDLSIHFTTDEIVNYCTVNIGEEEKEYIENHMHECSECRVRVFSCYFQKTWTPEKISELWQEHAKQKGASQQGTTIADVVAGLGNLLNVFKMPQVSFVYSAERGVKQEGECSLMLGAKIGWILRGETLDKGEMALMVRNKEGKTMAVEKSVSLDEAKEIKLRVKLSDGFDKLKEFWDGLKKEPQEVIERAFGKAGEFLIEPFLLPPRMMERLTLGSKGRKKKAKKIQSRFNIKNKAGAEIGELIIGDKEISLKSKETDISLTLFFEE